MNDYLDDAALFMTPKLTQHGGHMIMTNVQKQTRQKYINLDTRFRDDFQTSNLINYNITLPERINEIKSITVSNIELPISYYNISENLGNNSFGLTISDKPFTIIIPDGQYDISGIVVGVNTSISSAGITNINFSIQNNKSIFLNTDITRPTMIDFSINSSGVSNSNNLKFKIGGILGFQYSEYMLTSNSPSITSTGTVNMNGPRYLYVIIDEFSGKGNQAAFSTQLNNSSLGRNILARIQIDGRKFPYGSTLTANRGSSGLLTSNIRSYNGKIDVQRFNIQLVNEVGTIMDLNGQDLALCLFADYE
jgi:hypothetical protein